MLNLGCTFLGHGLKQDFRVINIQVPKAQVIDTAENFFVAARLRKLSLAFLAWYLLKEDIQLETHDSIEDARAALKLYAKYLEFVDAGVLDTMLAEIYRRGRELGFKPPPNRKGEEALPYDGSAAGLQVKKALTVPVSVSAPGSGSGSVRVTPEVGPAAMSRSGSAAPAAAVAPTIAPATAPSVEAQPTTEGGDGAAITSASASPEKPDTLA